ncbi:lipopolysaccharide biosynthesis protein [Streptococcus ruminantium]|uniref:lipopolysaccharide biosynthesis protein n=1 Tax=Streptococcus ruminantium TaxID=1917441 RepID=UPI0012DD06D1|nr:lipopolysaccharide biosynthesis protein [Streptococcus ruminantium]
MMQSRNIGKVGIIWNTIGTVFATLVSVVLLMVASRLTSPAVADTFSFSFTVAQQLYVVGLFGVRQYQSTDILEKNNFSEYFISRLLTIVCMMICLCFYLNFNKVSSDYILPIVFLTFHRSFDALSDVFQGFFQQHNRSDLAGKVLFGHSLSTILFFSISLVLFKSLNISVSAMLLVNFLLFIIQDIHYLKKYFSEDTLFTSIRNIKSVMDILFNCFPIFINAFLVNYIYSEPKFVISSVLQNNGNFAGLQRDFNIIFMPSFVLSLLVYILRPMLTELSVFWHKREIVSYQKQVKKLFLLLTLFHLVVLLGGYILGLPVLSIVFGVELGQYKLPFMILLIGGGLNVYSVLVDNLLTIHRKQSYLLVVTILTFIISKVITTPFIEHYSILGASISFALAMLVYFLLSIGIYVFIKKSLKNEL